MKEVVVELKDGRSYCGWMMDWRPLAGEFIMGVDPNHYPEEHLESGEITIRLGECVSAVKKNVQVTMHRIEDVDLLQEARDDVRHAIKHSQLHCKALGGGDGA